MRKAFVLFVLSIFLALFIVVPAFSADEPYYSVDAFDEYCNQWNDYYAKANPLFYCGYKDSVSTYDKVNYWYYEYR